MSLRSRFHISRYHNRGPAYAERIPSDQPLPMPAAPVQASAFDLPAEQRFALVYLRKAGAESLANKIARRLDEAGIPFPDGHHWRALRAEGYVVPGTIGHRLTPKGHRASEDIMRDLAFKYSVHHFIVTGGRGTLAGREISCTCRQFRSGPHPNNRAGDSRIASAQRFHLRQVEQGLPVLRPLEEFLNEYAPLKFNFAFPATAGSAPPAPTAVPESGAAGPDVRPAAPVGSPHTGA